jgi:hypothetical protein
MPALTHEIAQPSAVETHRDAIAAADTGTPAAAGFAVNPGDSRRARVWTTIAFTGGTNPTINVTPWLKAHGAATPLGKIDALQFGASADLAAGSYVFDVAVEGADLFAYLDATAGSPTALSVTVKVQWL